MIWIGVLLRVLLPQPVSLGVIFVTLEEFYTQIGGDYADTLVRLRKPERIEKYCLQFKADPSMTDFIQRMENGEYDEAFRAVHTLKGVCQTLGFTELYEAASLATEALRAGDVTSAHYASPIVVKEYEKIIAALDRFARTKRI